MLLQTEELSKQTILLWIKYNNRWQELGCMQTCLQKKVSLGYHYTSKTWHKFKVVEVTGRELQTYIWYMKYVHFLIAHSFGCKQGKILGWMWLLKQKKFY